MARRWKTRDYAELLDRDAFVDAVRTRSTPVAKTGLAVVAREVGVSRTMLARLASGGRTACTWGLAEQLEDAVGVERGGLFRYVAGRGKPGSRAGSAA